MQVHLTVDTQNAALYDALGAATAGLRAGQAPPTVENALVAVNRAYPEVKDPATQYFLAAGALQAAGNAAAGSEALQRLTDRDPRLAQEPGVKLLAGVFAVKQNQLDKALVDFTDAGKAVAPGDTQTQTTAKAFSAAVRMAQDKHEEAAAMLKAPDVNAKLQQDAAFSKNIGAMLQQPSFHDKALVAVHKGAFTDIAVSPK